MTGQWLPIVLASLPLVDLALRLALERIFARTADFQLDEALRRDTRQKVRDLVANAPLFKIIGIYFENAVRVRQVFPTVALATVSVWSAILELPASTNETVLQTFELAGKTYLALAVLFVISFLVTLASGTIKVSRDPEIKRRRRESPAFYSKVAFVFDFIAIAFGVVAKISG
jgi:hypothetical protein